MGRFFIPSKKSVVYLVSSASCQENIFTLPALKCLTGKHYMHGMKTTLESTPDPPWTGDQLHDVLWSRWASYY